MVASIFTREKLTQQTIAEEIMKGMVQNGLEPDKIGLFEPLRQPFSREGFLDLWRHETPGCYEDEVGMIGTAGGCFIKFKKPNLLMSSFWWDCPNEEPVNVISLYFTKATFKKNQQQIENIFRHTIYAANGFYGYISEAPVVYRQGSGNMFTSKLPGIYWCNYVGDPITRIFGKENLEAFDWSKAEEDDQNGLYLYTAEWPFGEWFKDDILEMQAKWQLGINLFEEASDLEIDFETYIIESEFDKG